MRHPSLENNDPSSYQMAWKNSMQNPCGPRIYLTPKIFRYNLMPKQIKQLLLSMVVATLIQIRIMPEYTTGKNFPQRISLSSFLMIFYM